MFLLIREKLIGHSWKQKMKNSLLRLFEEEQQTVPILIIKKTDFFLKTTNKQKRVIGKLAFIFIAVQQQKQNFRLVLTIF